MIGPKQGNGVDDMLRFLTRLQDASSDPKTRKNMLEKFNKGRRKNRDLSNGNFEGKNLSGIFLASADLQGANLRGANLRGAELQKATLKNAILDDAFLNGADLSGADLNFAQLKDADLQGATLDDADIQQACLKKADLSMASLKNARLYGSDLTDTKFKKANLEGAKLNKCRIEGSDFSDATFNTFRPLPKEASRPIGTWRLRVVTSETTRRCCAGLRDNALVESAEQGDDFIEDADEELGLEDEQDSNDTIPFDTFDTTVQTFVEKTVNVMKPAIAFLNLVLQTLDLALEKSLDLWKQIQNISSMDDATRKKTVQEKVPMIIRLLLEDFVIKFVEEDLLERDLHHNKMIDRLQKYFNALQTKMKNLGASPVDTSDVANKIKIEVEEFESIRKELKDVIQQPQQGQGQGQELQMIWTESGKFIIDELKSFLNKNILPTVEDETKMIIREIFQRMDTYLESLDQFMILLQKRLKKLLNSGLEKIMVKVLTKHCDESIAKLLNTAKQRVEMTEKYETLLIKKMEKVEGKMKMQFDRFFKKGSLHRRYMAHMIKTLKEKGTKYTINVNGEESNFDTLIGALRFSRVELNTDEAELNYLLDKLVTIGDMEVTIEKWRDAAQTWISLLNLRPQLKAERSVAVIDCIASDPEVIDALSTAYALLNSLGGSDTLVASLSNEPGRHIRDHGYRYQRSIRQEIVRIQKIRETQSFLISSIATVFATSLIALFNYLFTWYLQQEENHGVWLIPVIVISVIVVVSLLILLLVKCCRSMDQQERSSEEEEERVRLNQ